MKVKEIIRKIFASMGRSETYHVSASYIPKGNSGLAITSMTVKVTPWLHEDNYCQLIEFVKTKCNDVDGSPTITSITKLGL